MMEMKQKVLRKSYQVYIGKGSSRILYEAKGALKRTRKQTGILFFLSALHILLVTVLQ